MIEASQSILFDRHLAIFDDLCATLIERSLSHNLVPPEFRENLGPECPINSTEDENTNTNNGERVVRIPIRVPAALRRNKGNDCKKDVCQAVNDGNREERAPWG